jgi:hypothetical protein
MPALSSGKKELDPQERLAPEPLRPPAASFVSGRDVVIRLELQPLPEPGTGEADQDKAGNDEDDMQHAGSDAANRDKVQNGRQARLIGRIASGMRLKTA